jgi:hypothetical protein
MPRGGEGCTSTISLIILAMDLAIVAIVVSFLVCSVFDVLRSQFRIYSYVKY